MPSYRGVLGHKNLTLAMSLFSCSMPILTQDVASLAVPLGALAGLRLSPDRSDIPVFKKSLLDKALMLEDLRQEIPHRSKYSHTPVLGTAIRAIIPALLWLGGTLLISAWFPDCWGLSLRILGWWFLGLCLADGLHVLADIIESRIHRLQNNVITTKRRRRGRNQW